MYGCESWTIKKAEHWGTDAFELWCWRILFECPLDCKEIQPVHPKGNQSRIFIGRTDVEAETPILWPPDVKSWLIWKDPNVWKNWRQEEGDKRGWDGWMASPTQGTWVWVNSGNRWWKRGLLCCSPGGHKESDTTEWLNWTDLYVCVCVYIYKITIILSVLNEAGIVVTIW